MFLHPMSFTLKNGHPAILRPITEEDAPQLLYLLQQTAAETPFLGRCYQDVAYRTVEDQKAWINRKIKDSYSLCVFCFVDNKLVGDCELNLEQSLLKAHSASIGISILKDFWGLGIGSKMMEVILNCASEIRGLSQVTLSYYEGNNRGRALYEKFGFRVVCVVPDELYVYGKLLNKYRMVLKL